MGDRGAHQRETNTPTLACSTARIDAIMLLAAWHRATVAVYAAGAIVVMQAPLRNFPNVFWPQLPLEALASPSAYRANPGAGVIFLKPIVL